MTAASPVLVVDLDGTLLRSDLLHESFWSALGRDWRSPVLAARALLGGRAALKRHLASASAVEVASLPYDAGVLAQVERWRAEGGRTALVTAADQALADRVAAHLGLFDEVHGSDGRRNLKGEAKADFVRDRWEGGYAYMGDAPADLAVWKGARRAITVNAPPALRSRAEALGVEVEHLGAQARDRWPYLRALRPHQWVKNVLVLVPALAAHQLDPVTLGRALLAFLAFGLAASAVYILNDLLDLAADRAHPRKRRRPFASGEVPLLHGGAMAVGLFFGGLVIAAALSWASFLVLLTYVVATTAYSVHLKRRPMADIALLAGLYTMRLLMGGAATGIPLSVWLLAFAIFLFFSLAAVKRQAELVDNLRAGKAGAAGRGYLVEDLPILSAMALASGYVAVLVMALYLTSPAVMVLYPFPPALWGLCAVLLYWVSRVVFVTHRGRMHDDPIVFAARDRVSQVCLLLCLVFVLFGATP